MPIRLVHVGVGGRGRWPVRLASERDDYKTVALVDVDVENMAAAQEVSDLPESFCHNQLSDALDAVDADAVVVVTPPYQHAAQCLEAVKAGRHVLVEKPFAMRLSDAKTIVETAEKMSVCVAVCQNARYSAAAVTMSRLVAEEAYGKPSFGLMTRFNYRPGVKHSGLDTHSYLWERGIHDLDTMRAVFNAAPARVWGHSFNPAWSPYAGGAGAHAMIEFESGATCGYCCSFMAHKNASSFRLDLDEGTLEISGRELLFRRSGSSEDEAILIDDTPPPEQVLLDGFRDYIRDGVEPPFSGRHNLTTVALVEAVGASSEAGSVLDFRSYMDSVV